MDLLLSTIALRPYVFFFLAVFLWAASRHWGWRRTLSFTAIFWVVAYAAEFSSTRNGIPFGDYVYIEHTRDLELWIFNIPFFDSLSFTFLGYATYMTALALTLPLEKTAGGVHLLDDGKARLSLLTLLLSAFLFALIDVVIDPVALRGDQWFLGKIYYYTHGGIYFGVPISNFIGWAIVGGVSLFLYRGIEVLWGFGTGDKIQKPRRVTAHVLTGVGLYYLILVFNLSVTFYIGEIRLGLVGMLLYTPLTIILFLRLHSTARGGQ